MKRYGATRRQLFERLDRPALGPLPESRFVYGEWRYVKLNIDYHFALEHHFYSAPHQLIDERLDVRFTSTTVEIFLRGRRIDSHLRSYQRGGYTTKPEHMPKSHCEHAEFPAVHSGGAATLGEPGSAQCLARRGAVHDLTRARPHHCLRRPVQTAAS